MQKNKIFKIFSKFVFVVGVLSIAVILFVVVWVYIITARSNGRFEKASDAAIASIEIPKEAVLLREESRKQGIFDLDNGPSAAQTYKISGYNREELANFFNFENSPEQSIKFKRNNLTVSIYFWPTPDFNKINELGWDGYYEELAKKPVEEFSISIN